MYSIWMDKQAQHLSYLQKLAGSRMQSLEEWSCTFSLQNGHFESENGIIDAIIIDEFIGKDIL